MSSRDAAQLARFPQKVRIALTGATGLIGKALTRFLIQGGHGVIPMVRQRHLPGIYWNPDSGEIDRQALEGIDAVIHLAGEPIADHRWTDDFRQRVFDSRAKGTRLIAGALASLQKRPRVLISASAIGYYGDGGDKWLEETAPPGNGFLCEVCIAWEKSADPARDAGIRVVHPRIGLVLSKQGGALVEMMKPLRLGVSAQFGDGKHWQSWISLDDTIYALHYAMFTESIVGPMNVVTPNAVTQKDLVSAIARAMRRPALGSVPRAAARMLFGKEKADELFYQGQRVRPKVLTDAGYAFVLPQLDAMLRAALDEK